MSPEARQKHPVWVTFKFVVSPGEVELGLIGSRIPDDPLFPGRVCFQGDCQGGACA